MPIREILAGIWKDILGAGVIFGILSYFVPRTDTVQFNKVAFFLVIYVALDIIVRLLLHIQKLSAELANSKKTPKPYSAMTGGLDPSRLYND